LGLWTAAVTARRRVTGRRRRVCRFLVALGYSRCDFLWRYLRQQRLEQAGFEESATFEQIV
jgi:hypothetical protein